MKIKIRQGNIITSHRVIKNGSLLVDSGKITQIKEGDIADHADITIDAEGLFVAPGFIDLHVHGGGGSDFMDGTLEDFLRISETHMRYGTTAMFPTTLTAEKEDLLHTLDVYREALKKNTHGAAFLGMHIEGPYFSKNQPGAQDLRYIRNPDRSEYRDIIEKAGDLIARWDAAPELPGAMEFGRYLIDHHIIPAMAHTDAVYADVVKAVESGYLLATHFYSSMSAMTRKNAFRYAGVIESVYLMDEVAVEIIADGIHLPEPFLKLIYKIKGCDQISLITDAMRAAGTDEQSSVLGSKKDGIAVIIEDGVAKLPDKTSFAGSVATTDRLVRTMMHMGGVSLIEAVRMMSLNPARVMGVDNRKGSLAVGKDADILLFDEQIGIKKVMIAGEIML